MPVWCQFYFHRLSLALGLFSLPITGLMSCPLLEEIPLHHADSFYRLQSKPLPSLPGEEHSPTFSYSCAETPTRSAKEVLLELFRAHMNSVDTYLSYRESLDHEQTEKMESLSCSLNGKDTFTNEVKHLEEMVEEIGVDENTYQNLNKSEFLFYSERAQRYMHEKEDPTHGKSNPFPPKAGFQKIHKPVYKKLANFLGRILLTGPGPTTFQEHAVPLKKSFSREAQARDLRDGDDTETIPLEALLPPDEGKMRKIGLAQGSLTLTATLLSLLIDGITLGASTAVTGYALAGTNIVINSGAEAAKNHYANLSREGNDTGTALMTMLGGMNAIIAKGASTALSTGAIGHIIPFLGKFWAFNGSILLLKANLKNPTPEEAEQLRYVEKIYMNIVAEAIYSRLEMIDAAVWKAVLLLHKAAAADNQVKQEYCPITYLFNRLQCLCAAHAWLTRAYHRVHVAHIMRQKYLLRYTKPTAIHKPEKQPTLPKIIDMELREEDDQDITVKTVDIVPLDEMEKKEASLGIPSDAEQIELLRTLEHTLLQIDGG